MGFEPLVFEIAGGLDSEGDRILSSLYRAVDNHSQKSYMSNLEGISFVHISEICPWRIRDGDGSREREERYLSSSLFF